MPGGNASGSKAIQHRRVVTAAALGMRAALVGQRRYVIKVVGAFEGPTNGAAIVAGEDAYLGSDAAADNLLQRLAVAFGGNLQFADLGIAWGIADDSAPAL